MEITASYGCLRSRAGFFSKIGRRGALESGEAGSILNRVEQLQWVEAAVAQFEGPLTSYATRLVGNDRARDVVQDTFLRLCAQPREEVEERLGAWLFAVCRNRALDILRKDKRSRPLEASVEEKQVSPTPIASELAELKEETRIALGLLSELPPKQQEVIRLKFKHGLSYREISEVTRLSVSNVGYLIHIGLKTIRLRMNRIEMSAVGKQNGGSR